jgi:hypothetical protein
LAIKGSPTAIASILQVDKRTGAAQNVSLRSNFAFYHKRSIMIVLLGQYLRQIVICWVHISENDAGAAVFFSLGRRFNIRHSSAQGKLSLWRNF